MMSEHYHEQIPFYVEGRLTPDERARIEAHLHDCAVCRAELDQWRVIADAVRVRAGRSAASLPPLKLPVSESNTSNHRFTYSPEGEKVVYSAIVRPQPRSNPRQSLPGVTLAAALVMMIFAALMVLRFSQPSTALPTSSAATQTQEQTVYEILQNDPRFSLYAELVGYSAWISGILDGNEPVTVFALTDDVMLPLLDQLGGLPRMEGHTWEEALLFTHMVNGAWTLEELNIIKYVPGEWERAGQGHYRIGITVDTDKQGAMVLNADTHRKPVHILEGDIMASNGVIHVVDSTLLTDDVFSPSEDTPKGYVTIFDTLVTHPEYSIFTSFVKRSSYVTHVLDGTAPITVFVPTDKAFNSTFDEAALDTLKTSNLEIIEGFVAAHVLEGLWSAEMLVEAGSVRAAWEFGTHNYANTINTALSSPQSRMTRVNDLANITLANVITSNGVLHVVDAPIVDSDFLYLPE